MRSKRLPELPEIRACGQAKVALTRAALSDQAAVAQIVDGRLRRVLGMAVDDSIAAALSADDAITTVADGIWGAVAELSADGYGVRLTLLVPFANCHPE